MKRFLPLALLTTLTIFFATPAMLGIFDVWCFVMLGRAVSAIEWTEITIVLALGMLIPASGCVFVASIIAEPAAPLRPYVPGPPPPKRAGSNPPPTYERPPPPPSPPHVPQAQPER